MKRGEYLVGPVYDWLFFLGAPLGALAVGIAVSGSSLASAERTFGAERHTVVGLFTGVVVNSHLVAELFRSHANPQIRRKYPYRFFAVPALLWLAIVMSPWLAVATTVIATFWDVWHSGAQRAASRASTSATRYATRARTPARLLVQPAVVRRPDRRRRDADGPRAFVR
jgi:hypothetical protein